MPPSTASRAGEGPSSAPSERIGPFARRQLEQAGLGAAAERVLAGQTLDQADAARLAAAPWPLLAKLAELRREPAPLPALDASVHLPLAEWAARLGHHEAVDRARAALDELRREADTDRPWLIGWEPAAADPALRDEVLEIVTRLVDAARFALTAPRDSSTIRRELPRLRELGIERIESGDGDLLAAAAREGLAVLLTQSVPCAAPHELAGALLRARVALAAGDGWTGWSPQLSAPLDRLELGRDEPAGLDVLRAVALAALVLPPTTTIVAPAAVLGMKTAQVALRVGASHLGRVAIDEATAAACGLPLLAEVRMQLGLDQPTPINPHGSTS